MINSFKLIAAAILILLLGFSSCKEISKKKKPLYPKAARAMDFWFVQRAFPSGRINMSTWSEGYNAMEIAKNTARISASTPWEAIGPMNFGGRTLCLAFNPIDYNTMYAGSASGGLWRTYTGGVGVNAWHQVPTGFPVLGVAAIAINPNDSNEIYIGTGEVYNYQNTGSGWTDRTTRGTYGIGILKTSDGGITWSKSLDWQMDDMKGVQHILINPQNPNTVLSATSDGVYRSHDAGATWTLIHPVLMANDIDYIPGDTSAFFVTSGNQGSVGHGIYRTLNAGSTFSKISSGLPASFTGKALIGTSPSSPNVLYASIGDQFVQKGLYKSTDFGSTWALMSTEDVAKWQGWYSHDVAVRPTNPNEIIFVGIDAWRSTNSGTSLFQKSYWFNWNFNATPVGGPEGPPDYCHGDIHRVYYSPQSDSIIYYATDGGVFRSTDYGETFNGCNGMYHSTQFYSNISCSASDSLFVMGGMQDNATTIYEGNPAWRRVIGGDGLSTAINQNNDNITYGSYQYLGLRKSTNKAVTFSSLPNLPPGGSYNTNFAGPYELSRSNPSVLYAARDQVYKSTDAGDNWTVTNAPLTDPYLTIEISPISENIAFAASAPSPYNSAGTVQLYKTINGGTNWTNITSGLPNRYIMDIAADYIDPDLLYVVCSGFGTNHFWKSTNGGTTWTSPGTGLPDVPTNSVFIDPLNSLIIYVANDLGVYLSIDGGLNFVPWVDGLNDATMVMSMSYTASNRMLRIGTHGKGIYQRYLENSTITSVHEESEHPSFDVYPNPVSSTLTIAGLDKMTGKETLLITDALGRIIIQTDLNPISGSNKYDVDVHKLPAGNYMVTVLSKNKRWAKNFIKQ